MPLIGEANGDSFLMKRPELLHQGRSGHAVASQ
jgi:hypothetical protein